MVKRISKGKKRTKTEKVPAYKNPALAVSKRVKDLLSRMTIEEKTAQLMGLWRGGLDEFDAEFMKDDMKVKETFGKGANSIHPTFFGVKETVEIRNRIQKYFVEKTRLGIPVLFVDEGQHGMMRPESTVFPQAIGLACSWDPELFEKVYSVIAREIRTSGAHHVLSPVLDV